ncbi:MAG: hypothetical protein HY773_01240 [Candidatus Terrybacteria bacterium]|nr:hypothetical protein [Candidatus Terrybacteria bacterium]
MDKDKKELIIGGLGIFLVIFAFLGFPSSIQRIFMVLSGVVISFISFWKMISRSVAKITGEEPKENEKVF